MSIPILPPDRRESKAKLAGRKDGTLRKNAAHALLEARRRAALTIARRAFLEIALRDSVVDADAVHDAVNLPEGLDPRWLGAVPKPLANSRIVERAEMVKSARPERNGSYITRWALRDRASAEKWLRENPAPQMPDMTPAREHSSKQQTPTDQAPPRPTGPVCQRLLPGLEGITDA
jgi:hypothetical protein